jgi:hypothetical protein
MKGQEDAPFEVLIGIIIFVFVLSISSYLFEDYNRYQTEAKLDVELSNLANLIESVYYQAPGTKLLTDIDLSVLMSGEVKIKYLTFSNRDKNCLKKVGLESCWVIEVHAKDNWNSDYVIKRKYLNVPGSMDFEVSLETQSKEYNCGSYNETCLKMVSYHVEAQKEDENELKLVFG